MTKAEKTAISPTREQDFPEWYQQVIRAAELAEPSDVRGCMVIRPWGFGIWENMQRQLDAMFRATGHRNAYFPLFIPLSYFAKEAEHVEGFAKECASVTQFQSREGKQEFGWTTSWGMTTRMVGTLVMAHGDDDGIILPPRIAPTQIVILPITPKEETRSQVLEACDKLAAQLRANKYADLALEVEIDRRQFGGGVRNWEWIKKGVPIRIELGPRDLEKNSVTVSRRDQSVKEKQAMATNEFVSRASEILGSIQQNLYQRALKFRDANTRIINSKEEFYALFTPKNPAKPEIHGGFALAHWNGSREIEEKIKNDLKVTIRCIPSSDSEPGRCIFTGQASKKRVVWSKAY